MAAMNDASDMEDLFDEVQKEAEKKSQIIKELNDKKLEVEAFRTDKQYKKMQEALDLQKFVQNIDVSLNNSDDLDRVIESNTQYLNSVKHKSMTFLNESFHGVVPYMPNNLILVGARTGRGKSTTCANLSYQALMRGKKVLNISNEEKANDVYNRVTSLVKGEAYTDHANFSEEKVAEFNKYIKVLGQKMNVIDDEKVGKVGGASILEVVVSYIDAAVQAGVYDLILIDYYQKINISVENPNLSGYEVQAKFADYLGDILKHPNCPAIVLMAQLKPNKDEDDPIEERIEGRKIITKAPSCILEASPDYARRATKFKVHKSRWSEHNGAEIDVGFLRGKYVKYDRTFMQYVEQIKIEESQRKMLANVKPSGDKNE